MKKEFNKACVGEISKWGVGNINGQNKNDRKKETDKVNHKIFQFTFWMGNISNQKNNKKS